MRTAMTPGSLVLVGGHSRGVGKTLFIERWLRARRGEPWIAIKVSAHRHAPASVTMPLIEEAHEATAATQTGRYLAAGAARAFLVRAPDALLSLVPRFLESLRRGPSTKQSYSLIVESNRIVRFVSPDRVFFVVDPQNDDWKPSSVDCLRVPNVTVCCLRREACHDSHIVTPGVGHRAACGVD